MVVLRRRAGWSGEERVCLNHGWSRTGAGSTLRDIIVLSTIAHMGIDARSRGSEADGGGRGQTD